MSKVTTVLGKKDVSKLGRTLIHEHALIGFPGWFLDNRRGQYRRNEAMARVVEAFEKLKDYGVETVVDPCPSDLGRDVEFYAELSQKTGIDLVCATGVYYEAAGITYTFRHLEEEAITEIYVKEIEDGINETGIHPGLIKVATGDQAVSDYERKVLNAAAKAAQITGLPILGHTENCSCGHDHVDICTDAGVDPGKILVGHSDGTADGIGDLEYQISLAKRGVFLGFDRFGIELEVSDETRMKNLKGMVDHGFRDHVMMSHDTTNCWLAPHPSIPMEINDVSEVLPNWRMDHIFENIIPELKRRGMNDADFDVILKDNPRRFFE